MSMWRLTVIDTGLDWIPVVNALENDFREVTPDGPTVLTGVTIGPAGLYSFRTQATASRTSLFIILPRQGRSRIWLLIGPPLFLAGIAIPGVFAGIATAALLGGLLPRPIPPLLGLLAGLLVSGGITLYSLAQRDPADNTDAVLVNVMLRASNGKVAPQRPRDTIVR